MAKTDKVNKQAVKLFSYQFFGRWHKGIFPPFYQAPCIPRSTQSMQELEYSKRSPEEVCQYGCLLTLFSTHRMKKKALFIKQPIIDMNEWNVLGHENSGGSELNLGLG